MSITKRAVIVGAGINGLVAANYLARAGFAVTVVERKNKPGGACCAATTAINGIEYTYPQGASVLAMMPDFVFEETGLSGRVRIQKPTHPLIVYFPDGKPRLVPDDHAKFAQEMKEGWGENGKIEEFLTDMDCVISFLRKGFRDAVVPTVESAQTALGKELVALWITGSVRNLLDHYLTSDSVKLLFAIAAVESGPVSFDSPYSAFSIPLMASGSVFDGSWGYVRDGIWQIPLALDAINAELGVKRIFDARVIDVLHDDAMSVRFEHEGEEKQVAADYVLFATDPLTAARVTGQTAVEKAIAGQNVLGAAGKLVMIFSKPAQWKDDTGIPGFSSALRDIIPLTNLDDFEKSAQAVVNGTMHFVPGYVEIYCEGAGSRAMGGAQSYDVVSVFFNNLTASKTGDELPDVKGAVTNMVLSRIGNPGDLVGTVFETPKDLSNLFYFPGGNIDHIALADGQTFADRTYSPDPLGNFYQFGSNPRVFYCAAGTYPCGSVAGTAGYMCARQVIRSIAAG